MTHKIQIVLALLLAIIGGTGLFMAAPLYLNITLLCSVIIITWQWYKTSATIGFYSYDINLYKSFTLAVYILFLLSNILIEATTNSDYKFNAEDGVLRDTTDYFRGLVTFLITATIYGYVKHSKQLMLMPLLCLITVLIGQFLEVTQLLIIRPSPVDDFNLENMREPTLEEIIVRRPNGYTNANMTAAIALIWFFVSVEAKTKSPAFIQGLTYILTLTICVISQSRAALLFLLLYFMYKLVVFKNYKFILFLLIFGLIGSGLAINLYPEITQGIIDSFISRADSKEDSALERMQLINLSIDSFFNSPIFGNGIYSLQKIAGLGLSSHNQILETLTNFGLVGFFVMLLVYITFYHINSFLYLSMCVLPTLLFSHNFFDSFGYQVALAFAYTVSKSNQIGKNA